MQSYMNFIHLRFHEALMIKLWQNICNRRARTNRDTRIVFADTTFATFQSRKADFAYQLDLSQVYLESFLLPCVI